MTCAAQPRIWIAFPAEIGTDPHMIRAISILLLFQLAGESLSRGLDLFVPGPVIGLAALFIALLIFPQLAEVIRAAANGLLAHLSLLFVPAGVGVIAHLGTFGTSGIGLIVALIVSTALAILAAVLTFVLFARLMGQSHE